MKTNIGSKAAHQDLKIDMLLVPIIVDLQTCSSPADQRQFEGLL